MRWAAWTNSGIYRNGSHPGFSPTIRHSGHANFADIDWLRYAAAMKLYVIRPIVDVFDGSGALSETSRAALLLIAHMVADSLRAGGDCSHHAAIWEGIAAAKTPPQIIALSEKDAVIELALRLLDPNVALGGEIRSTANCRSASFGQDGQALLCLRHEDRAPASANPSLVRTTESSAWLTGTDLLDGSWPKT